MRIKEGKLYRVSCHVDANVERTGPFYEMDTFEDINKHLKILALAPGSLCVSHWRVLVRFLT